MNNNEVKKITNIIYNVLELLYMKETKRYIMNIKWALNNTNILVKEMFEEKILLNLDIEGQVDIYNIIIKNIIDLVSKNKNTYGCLNTVNIAGNRAISSEYIKSNNIEINIPIYNRNQLAQAESINNEMLKNYSIEKTNIKTLTKKTASKL